MHGTVLRCHQCGRGMETKRPDYFGERRRLYVCECTPWEGEPLLREVTNPRRVSTPGSKLVQRE